MNEGIELHDSELASLTFNDGEIVLQFTPAYVHRSCGRPGIDAGSGWLQSATLTLGGANPVAISAPLPATISDGVFRVGGELQSNVIPANGTLEGAVELSLVLTNGETLIFTGQRLSIQLHGTPTFVENFTPSA